MAYLARCATLVYAAGYAWPAKGVTGNWDKMGPWNIGDSVDGQGDSISQYAEYASALCHDAMTAINPNNPTHLMYTRPPMWENAHIPAHACF